MLIPIGQIAGLFEQLAQAIHGLDLRDCPFFIGSLEQLKAMALGRMTVAPGASDLPATHFHERYLTVSEVAERYHVTPKWLYKHKKHLPHSQPSRKVLLFPEAGIANFFASRKYRD